MLLSVGVDALPFVLSLHLPSACSNMPWLLSQNIVSNVDHHFQINPVANKKKAVFFVQACSDAAEVVKLVTQGRDEIVNNRLLPVLQGGYLGSSWWSAACLQHQ